VDLDLELLDPSTLVIYVKQFELNFVTFSLTVGSKAVDRLDTGLIHLRCVGWPCVAVPGCDAISDQ